MSDFYHGKPILGLPYLMVQLIPYIYKPHTNLSDTPQAVLMTGDHQDLWSPWYLAKDRDLDINTLSCRGLQ